jgi:hypothetical protein
LEEDNAKNAMAHGIDKELLFLEFEKILGKHPPVLNLPRRICMNSN